MTVSWLSNFDKFDPKLNIPCRGEAGGCHKVTVTPHFVSLSVSKRATTSGKNFMGTLILTQCDPPFKKSWLCSCPVTQTKVMETSYLYGCTDTIVNNSSVKTVVK